MELKVIDLDGRKIKKVNYREFMKKIKREPNSLTNEKLKEILEL